MYFFVYQNGVKNHTGYYVSLRGCVLSCSNFDPNEIKIRFSDRQNNVGTIYDGSVSHFITTISLDGVTLYNLHSWKSLMNWFYIQCNGFLKHHNCFLDHINTSTLKSILVYKTAKVNSISGWEKEGF